MKYNCMKVVLVFATSLLISVSAFADTEIKNNKKVNETEVVSTIENVNVLQLNGIVVDENTNETLAGATIIVDGKKYYSNLDGNFQVKDVKPGKYELIVDLISYEPVSMVVDLSKSQNLNINLHQK